MPDSPPANYHKDLESAAIKLGLHNSQLALEAVIKRAAPAVIFIVFIAALFSCIWRDEGWLTMLKVGSVTFIFGGLMGFVQGSTPALERHLWFSATIGTSAFILIIAVALFAWLMSAETLPLVSALVKEYLGFVIIHLFLFSFSYIIFSCVKVSHGKFHIVNPVITPEKEDKNDV